MSDIYPANVYAVRSQLTAEEIVRDHGENAFAIAQKQINACNSRGDYSTAESWVYICRRIRELQAK